MRNRAGHAGRTSLANRRREVAVSIPLSQEASKIRSAVGTQRSYMAPAPLALILSQAVQQGVTNEMAVAVVIGPDEYFTNV
jgi:hypothetical protein